jgi:hypothetical protein
MMQIFKQGERMVITEDGKETSYIVSNCTTIGSKMHLRAHKALGSFKKGDTYWYPESGEEAGIDCMEWQGDEVDMIRLKRGCAFCTKEEAQTKARELGWME